ncbi:unnamed protein product [Phytophthora fragariaefolia]|uniref:Unnamed protein product n=1 Tax=Phytophthora fragariaefolia TaxID=1490495 RepID=A0A9W6XX66_9STRA|nr:unnamed protein product [Phytophthora fragariaefolia]
MLAELHCRDGRTTLNEFANARGSDRSDRSSDDGSERGSDDSGRSNEEWGDDLSPDESGRYLAAANESERRAAAEVSTLQRPFKLGSPPTETGLVPMGLPQLAAPAIEAECIFAFVGKCEWPNDGEDISVNTTETEQERCACLGGSERNKVTQEEVKEEGPDNWILSARQEEKPRRELAKEVQLLPGERLGWWSEQQFDRRVRMRTLVNGAVNNTRTRILLDTGGNVSVISEKYARKLRLREILGHGRCMEGQGITKGKTTTTRRGSVKITLGWERVYVFELWIMDHNAVVDVVLGTDFMIPAGFPLDWFQANAKLPDEVMIPLIKTMSMLDEPEVPQTEEGPTESKQFQVENGGSSSCGEINHQRQLTSYGYDELRMAGLAYEAVRDKTLFRRERELYEEWLAAQPPAVDRPSYPRPKQILRRYLDNSDSDSGGTIADGEAEDSSVDEDPAGSHKVHEGIVSVVISGHPTAGEVTTAHSGNATSKARGTVHKAVVSEAMTNSEPPGCSPGVPIAVATTIEASPDNSIDVLEQTFVSVVRVLTTEGTDRGNDNSYEHVAAEFELEDYAKELAFLPDLTEPAETMLDYTADNVRNPELSAEQQASLIAVLKNHDKIMIASGNALPPPAYGVVCDIDVGGHAPINPWASPIVIVLKKNGLDIRLCIDYKLVNAVTMIMEYAMPLVDDLLTDLEAYLWFCSLDAASGFWAIMMTMRARKISAFVCPLGHFEWLRMPFGLKNAPMIYQRMIDNALRGFVQPKGGWRAFADRMQAAEERACGGPHHRLRLAVIARTCPRTCAGQQRWCPEWATRSFHRQVAAAVVGPAAVGVGGTSQSGYPASITGTYPRLQGQSQRLATVNTDCAGQPQSHCCAIASRQDAGRAVHWPTASFATTGGVPGARCDPERAASSNLG